MDKVTFDTSDYVLRLDQEGYRGWTLRRDDGSGDVLSLNYFAKPPDMEAPPRTTLTRTVIRIGECWPKLVEPSFKWKR